MGWNQYLQCDRPHLAALALLDPKVEAVILCIVATVPVDLLGGSVANINGEPGAAVVGEVALGILPEAVHVAVLGNSTRVRDGEGDRGHVLLHDVEVLEGSGDTVLGGEGDHAVGGGAQDEDFFAIGSVTADVDVLWIIFVSGRSRTLGTYTKRGLTAISQSGSAAISNQSEGRREGSVVGRDSSSADDRQKGGKSSNGELHFECVVRVKIGYKGESAWYGS